MDVSHALHWTTYPQITHISKNWCQTCVSLMCFNLFPDLCDITSFLSMYCARRVTIRLKLTHVSVWQAFWHKKTDYCGSHRLKFRLSHTCPYIVTCVMATVFCILTSALFIVLSGNISVFISFKSIFYCKVLYC